ncbi:hypothetical protein [Nitratidesulfovibrio liaohensis]|uniref:Uncharacterized protein n=1 Tax=Nitratidesulfovibrio liaohensis TaxID=2604158 RepID=A0ABY9QXZ8_9BACT|nr:hypothetical protein [Nitratidesulfovibrio liaohensis]WMW64374.1 hypothetical protein KPS_002386 [Nitratidesulfovibrio liaohensis]
MNGTMAMERTEAQSMAALRADLSCDAGRHRMRAALREVLDAVERDNSAVRLMKFGVHATAMNVLRSRPADGALAPMDRRYVYEAMGAVMEEVVRHNLLAPTDAAYVNAMDAMAACEGK